jgi:hypothetical protein
MATYDSARNSGNESNARNVNKCIYIVQKSVHISIHLHRKATFTMYTCVAISALNAEKRV